MTAWVRLAVLLAALVGASPAAHAASPLEPADTSSPRATLESLVGLVDTAYRAAIAGDRSAAALALRRATRTLDTSGLPPRFVDDRATEAVIMLKEILDRIDLPPAEAIPGEGTDVARWRIPHTEIAIARITAGHRAGDYLFTPDTVYRVGEFHKLVRALPAKPGGTPGILDGWRANPGSGLAVEWGRRIPGWAKESVAGATVWQWIATALVLTLTAALVAATLMAGRAIRKRQTDAGLGKRLGLAMIGALAAATGLVFVAQRILDQVVNLTGGVLVTVTFVLDLTSTVLLGWLAVLVVFAIAETAILVRGLDPAAATGRLVRLFAGGVAVVLVVAIVVAAAQGFGLPAYSIVTGLGVGGIAIGFGAQTLVRDVFSGIFFLVDDAFRPGEYIDVGTAKGVVERVSVRSIQLRHHSGPLQTVPFGEIKGINNLSRDWVIMKLTFRLTFETDPDRVRKLINKLGREMMADPELGPQFLEPLKSQGVMEVDDFGLVMRVKFMTRPGEQFMLRRTVWQRLREMFEREGIEFAGREVRVRGDGEVDPGRAMEIATDEPKGKAA